MTVLRPTEKEQAVWSPSFFSFSCNLYLDFNFASVCLICWQGLPLRLPIFYTQIHLNFHGRGNHTHRGIYSHNGIMCGALLAEEFERLSLGLILLLLLTHFGPQP